MKNTTKTAAGTAMLFGDGWDPVEDAVRGRVRGVIAKIMRRSWTHSGAPAPRARRKAAGSSDAAALHRP